jgi:predicted secreted hydrolase
METSGKIFLKGETIPVKGTSWMDHEFSSNQLSENLVGWDWFSIKLDNQTELMLYQLRDKNKGKDPYSSGTLIMPNGQSRHLHNHEFTISTKKFWTSPHTQATYPAGWTLTLPEGALNITPDLSDQELYNLRSISGSYWEGSVTIKGKLNGKQVSGKGYVELVGYEKPLQQELPD